MTFGLHKQTSSDKIYWRRAANWETSRFGSWRIRLLIVVTQVLSNMHQGFIQHVTFQNLPWPNRRFGTPFFFWSASIVQVCWFSGRIKEVFWRFNNWSSVIFNANCLRIENKLKVGIRPWHDIGSFANRPPDTVLEVAQHLITFRWHPDSNRMDLADAVQKLRMGLAACQTGWIIGRLFFVFAPAFSKQNMIKSLVGNHVLNISNYDNDDLCVQNILIQKWNW